MERYIKANRKVAEFLQLTDLAMDADGKVFVDADGNPFIFH